MEVSHVTRPDMHKDTDLSVFGKLAFSGQKGLVGTERHPEESTYTGCAAEVRTFGGTLSLKHVPRLWTTMIPHRSRRRAGLAFLSGARIHRLTYEHGGRARPSLHQQAARRGLAP